MNKYKISDRWKLQDQRTDYIILMRGYDYKTNIDKEYVHWHKELDTQFLCYIRVLFVLKRVISKLMDVQGTSEILVKF